MIKYTTGNIFDSDTEALVNTVNLDGVMGKGIALQFKQNYPENFRLYKKACKDGDINIGKLFVTKDSNLHSNKIIINFPTKVSWRKSSEYIFIEKGLIDLKKIIKENNIKSISIPPLGSGNGGLIWNKVKDLIESILQDLDTEIVIYEPNKHIVEKLKKEKVKLTPARGLLLYVLNDLVRNGEYVSEFSSEKVCYFLQKFGAQKYFNLNFEPNFYGPYSGKVRFVLNALNGSYLMGFSDMNNKAFEPISLLQDSFSDIAHIIESNSELFTIATKTKEFLSGFYSDFTLELLSSVDYLIVKHNTYDFETIKKLLNSWSLRKQSIFNNDEYIKLAIHHIKSYD